MRQVRARAKSERARMGGGGRGKEVVYSEAEHTHVHTCGGVRIFIIIGASVIITSFASAQSGQTLTRAAWAQMQPTTSASNAGIATAVS